jgi:hypothetical protein
MRESNMKQKENNNYIKSRKINNLIISTVGKNEKKI